MGERLGRYELERKLAVGGMAEVWLARAQGPGGFSKQVVLKRVLEHLASEPRFADMFQHEAALVAQLDHPNIVQLFDFGEQDGTHYLAMEYVDGPSLKGLLKAAKTAGRPFPFEVAARVVAQACEGMAYAHQSRDRETGALLGLVHRDISPDNILLSRAGAVKVADFGIAKSVVQRHRTKTGMVKGKLAYMSPEQLTAEPLDCRADVYALGVVLYELLTLARPFDATGTAELMRAVVSEPIVPVRTRRSEVPQELAAVAERALEKDRGQRFADCLEMQRALEGWLVRSGMSVSAWDVASWMKTVEAGQANRTADLTQEELQEMLEASAPATAVPAPVHRWMGLAAAGALVVAASVLVLWALQHQEAPSPPRPALGLAADPARLNRTYEEASARVEAVREGGRCGGTAQAQALLERFGKLQQERAALGAGEEPGALVVRARRWMDEVEAECSLQEKVAAQWHSQERWLSQLRLRLNELKGPGACTAAELAAARAALEEGARALAVPPSDRRGPPPPAAVQAGDSAERLLGRCSAGQGEGGRSPAREGTRSAPAAVASRGDPGEEFRLGTEAVKSRSFHLAAAHFKQCLELMPSYAQCWRGLGVTYAKMDRPREGLLAYRRFLELAPDDPAAPKVRKAVEEYEKSQGR